jgi:hypothetical protein
MGHADAAQQSCPKPDRVGALEPCALDSSGIPNGSRKIGIANGDHRCWAAGLARR